MIHACRIVIALAFAPALALAQAQRVAVLPIDATGDAVADEVRVTLRRGVVGGFASGGGDPRDVEDVDRALAANPALAGCTTSPCLRRIGELVGAPLVVATQVEIVGSSYTFRLRLAETADGATRAAIEESCDVCTMAEASDALSRAAALLAKPVARPPVPAGEPSAETRRKRETKPRWRRALPWAALGGGVFGLGVGAGLVVLDGGGTCDGAGECPREYDTGSAGIATLAVGGVLLVGAGVLWLIE
ncbi:MAG: hypothetical protein AABZ30_10110 [Myxococcota bacterium]